MDPQKYGAVASEDTYTYCNILGNYMQHEWTLACVELSGQVLHVACVHASMLFLCQDAWMLACQDTSVESRMHKRYHARILAYPETSMHERQHARIAACVESSMPVCQHARMLALARMFACISTNVHASFYSWMLVYLGLNKPRCLLACFQDA